MEKNNNLIIYIVIAFAFVCSVGFWLMGFGSLQIAMESMQTNEVERVNIPQMGGYDSIYLTSDPEYSTTSVAVCNRSAYYDYPTSSDDTAGTWVCATTTGTGTPWEVLDANTGRQGFECCVYSNTAPTSTATLWMQNTATANMSSRPTTTKGFRLESGECLKDHDYGIIWSGTVLGLSEVATTTVRCVEF